MRLRIVNLNTWVGLLVRSLVGVERLESRQHKRKRVAAMVASLRALDPDIVTLQECLPMAALPEQLAANLGYDCLWRVNNGGLRLGVFGIPWGMGRGEGLAILARPSLKLRRIADIKLSGAGFVRNWVSAQLGAVRHAMIAAVTVGGHDVVVACTHVRYAFPGQAAFDAGWKRIYEFGLVDEPAAPPKLHRMARRHRSERDREMVRLGEALNHAAAAHQGAPIIVGADFNLDPGAPQVDALAATIDAVNTLPRFAPDALTWDPARNPNIGRSLPMSWKSGAPKPVSLKLMSVLDAIPQCPDHVLASRHFTPVDAQLAFTEPVDGVHASDHFGIVSDLALG